MTYNAEEKLHIPLILHVKTRETMDMDAMGNEESAYENRNFVIVVNLPLYG
jgi:hypothetical protein